MAPRSANVAVARKFDKAATGSIGRSGWVVQIGSMPSASQARNILKNTKNNARALIGNKAGFVQPFEMDGTIYHRARFRGFKSKEEAWTTCEALIEESIQCYAVRHSVDLAT